MNLLQISWWNDHDLGDILYQNGFRNKIYIDVEVEKPEYNVSIESDLNGDAVEITKFRKWEKVYRFECWMQEDLVDAFSLMQIHDNIEITLQSGDVIQVAKHGLRVEPSWEEIGCLAKCIVSFAENYIVAGNCNENKDLTCLCTGTPPQFWEIIEYADLGAYTPQYIPIVLAWTVADIALKKYTAQLWQYASGWISLTPDQNDCWENFKDNRFYIFDGQYWQLSPGYIIALTDTGTDLEVSAWVLPGAFGNVYYSKNGGGSVLVGAYSRDDIESGITFAHSGAGTYNVWVTVYNHSCAYLNTEDAEIII